MYQLVMYVSGPMRGKPDDNRPLFERGALLGQAAGFRTIIPHDLDVRHDNHLCAGLEVDPTNSHRYGCYLRKDIAALCRADAILLLPGWAISYGAGVEVHVACALGLERWVMESNPGEPDSYAIRRQGWPLPKRRPSLDLRDLPLPDHTEVRVVSQGHPPIGYGHVETRPVGIPRGSIEGWPS